MPLAASTTDTPSSAAPFADTLGPSRAPATSATSDMPVIDLAAPKPAEPVAETPAESEAIDGAAKPADAEGTVAEPAAGEADGEPSAEPAEEPAAREGRETPPWMKARITAESNKRRAAEQQATTLQTQLGQALKALEKLTGEPAQPQEDPRPSRDAYDNPDAYDKALLDWGERAVTAKVKADAKTEQARNEQNRQATTMIESYRTRQSEFAAAHPDFDDVVMSDDLNLSLPVSQAILEADDGPAIAYWLGQNPEEAERISGLSTARALIEIGKISTKLVAPPPKPKPAPIRPLATRNTAGDKDPSEMSMEEYASTYSPNRRKTN